MICSAIKYINKAAIGLNLELVLIKEVFILENIREDILDILKNHFDIEYRNTDDYDSLNFFSMNMKLNIRNMVYMVLLLEKKYNIRFTENDYDSSEFYTLNGLCKILFDHIENARL
jgi:hypothetical protein